MRRQIPAHFFNFLKICHYQTVFMVYSAEIRWFFNNLTEVNALEKWFNSRNLFFAGNWDRADIYLWQPGLEKLGIKIREGKVEVKVLLADKGEWPLAAENSGLANDWVKYSFGLQESDEENKKLLQQFSSATLKTENDLWVRVDKERLLQKYAINLAEKHIQPIAPDAWPEEGCGVELTKVKINEQTYYTFGLEAFSKSHQESGNLRFVLNMLLPEIPGQNLKAQQSYSYPSFLNKLYTDKGRSD
ncbi:hypothetical protein HUW51_23540 [Adhaeribacter swui]|uniref:Uncharacterized protein n=1 Tax=Adhaeribacter swui TaxID=2086471 RepID=A0A7G7GEF0_9BACT|nr:hypothetical protein [Adhaeribacter swui]QNF35534.1 hypothetical protein HUW51_23540 [Adhaeribacter swui]